MSAGWKKVKRNRCPGYTTASRLMNTKPLCLSHLEIDRWKLLCYISFLVNISFYLSAYFPLAEIFILYFTLPQPHNFLMVHLTLRAEPPCLVHQVIKRAMNGSAAGRVHGSSLSFIQWRIQGRDPGGLDQNFLETCPSPPPYLRVWMIAPLPPPPYLKVWIRLCYLPPKLLQYVAFAVTLRSHGRAEAGRHKEEHILLLKVR